MSAIKSDRDYLIGAEVVIETNCLSILVMISSCTMPDMAMLHWIAYVKSLYPEIQHVAGKGNVVVASCHVQDIVLKKIHILMKRMLA